MSIRIAEQGGTAFPTTGPMFHNGEESIGQQPGMTLRDYFAAKVMPTVIRSSIGGFDKEMVASVMASPESGQWVREAGVAYAIADAMLKARAAK